MSLTCARILHIVAFALFLLAFLVPILAIPFQGQIKSLYTTDPEVLMVTSVPIEAIVNTVIRLLIAGVYLVLILLLKPTKGGSIAVVIVFSVLLVLNGVLISPLIGLGFQSAVARYGAVMMASHAALSGFVSGLVSFFTVPASILMYLSMGGYWGKTRPAPKPFVPHP